MTLQKTLFIKKIFITSTLLLTLLLIAMYLGISIGSSGYNFNQIFSTLFNSTNKNSTLFTIIWEIRFPRVILAIFVGATLSVGGLVFQALLKNPLSEPYILGVSGGSAIGAIIGILLGFSRFFGVAFLSFFGSMLTLFFIIMLSLRQGFLKKDSLILAGVMLNSFCAAIIMFLISIAQNTKLQSILFWIMGDLSNADLFQVVILICILTPCLIVIFLFSHKMNILLMGDEMAKTMGINVKAINIVLLTITSFMISVTVCQCGLLGFVGLVIPHIFRLILGPDHRVLVPACILGGAIYMVLCDLLARTLIIQGQMPVGVITALIGAPIFIFLLQRKKQ